MKWQDDYRYRESTVDSAEPCDGGWFVRDADGWSLLVTNSQCDVEPQAGEAYLMFGEGIGRPVRGIVIGGRVYRYQTEAEHEEEWKAEMEEAARKKAQEYELKRGDYDRRVEALPDVLRERITAFRARRGDAWRYEFEPYEVFVCEQAAAFASAFDSIDGLEAFAALTYDEQRSAVPAMSDGHSGNTFGMACRLAAALIKSANETAKRMHGALCPMVGCEKYGCWSTVAPQHQEAR